MQRIFLHGLGQRAADWAEVTGALTKPEGVLCPDLFPLIAGKEAVYDSLFGRGADSISCIRQDNGLWHMVLKMDDGAASYETWEERDGFLILIDCGEGSVSLQEEGGQGE